MGSAAEAVAAEDADWDTDRIYRSDEIRQHPFFAGIEWAALEAKQIPPPFMVAPQPRALDRPAQANATSFEYFDIDGSVAAEERE